MDLTDIYRMFQLKAVKYTFFSNTPRTFSRIDHILGHKSSLSKFQKTEIVSSIFSDNPIGLEINYGGKKPKKNKYIYTKQWVTEDIQKNTQETNDNRNTIVQDLRGTFITIQCYLNKQE